MFQQLQRPMYRPSINIGGMFDIPSGNYVRGKHGESILDGGVASITGIASRPNNFKTAIGAYQQAMIRRACHHVHSVVYDTEGTLSPVPRYTALSQHYDYLRDIDYEHDPQFWFTDLSRYSGDHFYKEYDTIVRNKPKQPKEYMRTTPFLDSDGKNLMAMYPTSLFIDSFSKFQTSEVQQMYEKNKIGDAKNNTDAMTLGKAKNQLFNQLPQMTAQTGTYLFMTAHVGDIIQMEMYPTDKRNLAGLKKDTVIKGVSSGFYSMPNNLWSIESNKPLLNSEKMPLYPKDNATAFEGDTDLKILEVKNLRGKNGASDILMPLVVSQTEGYLPSLTEFHYCKDKDYGAGFGIGGNDRNYYIELRPDVALSRTTVRRKLDGDPLLRRAMEIQAEMLQLLIFHRTDPEQVYCTPKELYEDLKTLGYDWDQLLTTRGYWVFEEEEHEHPQKFLSTMDLLRMRKGLYIPYWMTQEEKDKIRSGIAEQAMKEAQAKTAKAA